MSLQEWVSVFKESAGELEDDYGDSWGIEFDDSIEPGTQAHNWFQYIRGAFARFQCSKCKKTWPSKRVLVVFHFSLNSREQKGTVKVRRFRQKCKRCSQAKMEEPHFNRGNIEVLLDKLVEKIRIRCYNEDRGELIRPFQAEGRSEGPHESALCEACQRGFCQKSE